MLLERGTPQRDEMHDREDAGLLEEALLLGAIVGKQPHHLAVTLDERIGRTRRDRGIDLAAVQHRRQARLRPRRVAHAARQIERNFLGAARLVDARLQPLDRGEVNAIVLRQEAAHIDAGGLRPFRNSNRALVEVLGALDAAVGAHVDRGVAMHARGKHRDRHHRGRALRGERGVFPERQLGHVPFQVLEEAEGDLLDGVEHQRRERDAVRAHRAGHDVAGVVVVADRKRQMHRGGAMVAEDLRVAHGGLAAACAAGGNGNIHQELREDEGAH